MNININLDLVMDENATYYEGYNAGRAAALSRGGTNGAEWFAEQRNLAGNLREIFIDAFNEGLDSTNEYQDND